MNNHQKRLQPVKRLRLKLALELREKNNLTYDNIGAVFNISRERARQLVSSGERVRRREELNKKSV